MHIKKVRVAMVTGGGSGIGRGVALQIAKNGGRVVVCDINEENANIVANEIRDLGSEAIAVVGDVGSKKDCQRMVEAGIDKWGSLSILIANAGIIKDSLIQNLSETDWDEVIRIDLKGVFLAIQAAMEPMVKQQYGRIVTVSSVANRGNIGQANYSAAKAGVVALSKTAALELAPYNITVNCIAPGIIETPVVKSLPKKVFDRLAKATPVGRIGKTEDINQIIMALIAEEASFITGQVISIDGGMTTGLRLF